MQVLCCLLWALAGALGLGWLAGAVDFCTQRIKHSTAEWVGNSERNCFVVDVV